MILDIHTHHKAPDPMAIIDASPRLGMPDMEIVENQYYSTGIHPYDTIAEIPDTLWQRLEVCLDNPQFVAVGEGGIDLSGKGGALYRQLKVFKRLVDLSENHDKPLLVHCVKADDIICGLRRDLKPKQTWVIHGFRKKPESAAQLLRAGCMLSFGPNFNEATLRSVPTDGLLAETDDSSKSIEEVIAKMSEIRGMFLTDIIVENTTLLLHLYNADNLPDNLDN